MTYVCKSIDGISGRKGAALDWAAWAGRVALIPALGILLSMHLRHETRTDNVEARVISIEASRFKAGDGLEVWREIAAIREVLATKVEAGAEPLRDDIRELKAGQLRLENLIREYHSQ